MNRSTIHWFDLSAARPFRTGVSLHSHTSLSKESLSFIPRHTQDVPVLSTGIRKLEASYRRHHGEELDYQNVYWTPPLSPLEAFVLERAQIENKLGLSALVSLTDHDDMDAGCAVVGLGAPVSVEWTVPLDPVFFHIGLHNVPYEWMEELRSVTADPRPERVKAVLSAIHSLPGTLIVLNHPLWDEVRAGREIHRSALEVFLDHYRPWLDALELNGLRSAAENREVVAMADALGLAAVSGGDRHGLEPNALINLTHAGTFEDFATDVRLTGHSTVLFLEQYRRSIHLRTLKVMCDVLRDTPTSRWSDRVFYRSRRLSEVMGTRAPGVIGQFLAFIRLAEVFL